MFYAWKVFQLRLRPEVKGRPKKESATNTMQKNRPKTRLNNPTNAHENPKCTHTTRNTRPSPHAPTNRTPASKNHTHRATHTHLHIHEILVHKLQHPPPTNRTFNCNTHTPRHNNATTPPSTPTAGYGEQRTTHEEDDYDPRTKAIRTLEQHSLVQTVRNKT